MMACLATGGHTNLSLVTAREGCRSYKWVQGREPRAEGRREAKGLLTKFPYSTHAKGAGGVMPLSLRSDSTRVSGAVIE